MAKELKEDSIFLDEIDRLLLELLKSNAKWNTKELAEKVGLTNTPTYERVKRLEKFGFIKGYRAVLDSKKMGLSLLVLINVQLKSHASTYLEEFEQEIITLSEVETCYHIAGHFDYLLQVEIEDMEAYAVFVKEKLSKIPHIATVQSSFVMRKLKS
jgi:DNA-binding Lrp family transcriptional regulator